MKKIQTLPDTELEKINIPTIFVRCVNGENLIGFENFPEKDKIYVLKNIRYSKTSAIGMVQLIGLDIEKETFGKYWGFSIDRFEFTNICPN
jgi:hypothetical protein